MKMMLAVLTAASIIPTAACADPPTESEQYGIDTVGRSAAARLKDNRGMKLRDACQAEVSGLPKETCWRSTTLTRSSEDASAGIAARVDLSTPKTTRLLLRSRRAGTRSGDHSERVGNEVQDDPSSNSRRSMTSTSVSNS